MSNWRRGKLGELAHGQRGVTYAAGDLRTDSGPGTVVLLRSNNISDGQLNFSDVQIVPDRLVSDEQTLRFGDIAVCMSNGSKALVGKAAPFLEPHPERTTVGAFCSVFRPSSDADPRFVSYAFQSSEYRRNLDFSLAGTAINNLRNKDLEGFPCDIPPFAEQVAIGRVLLALDTAIRETDAIIAKLKAVKQGLLHELLTRGIDANGELRPPQTEAPHLYKQSPLGWIPKTWDAPLLDEVSKRGSGHTPNKDTPSYWNGGIKWVSLADSHRLDMIYIRETGKQISALGIANSSAVLHPSGTVVLSRDAGIGKSGILSGEMAVSQHFIAWACGELLNNLYLYFWLQHEKPRFEAIAIGSTIKTIGLPFFKAYRVPVPSRTEQDLVVRVLLGAAEGVARHDMELGQLRELKAGLMDDLLTGRVRVTPLLEGAGTA